ncbi:single-stranded DNA-binding protein [Phascolarctobacterium faecium]|uniref:single-stranded DNA-binding protein n=1 Tax=Phascolarctobacterium faecium TaxID=33025 RepID=UPI003AB7920D
MLVEGRLQVRTFEANDGSKRWVTEVIGSHIEFIEKKEDFGGPGGNEYTGAPFDEEIPF